MLGTSRFAFAAQVAGRTLTVLAVSAFLAGCGGGKFAREAVPQALEDSTHVDGTGSATVRYWGDELPSHSDIGRFQQQRLAQLRRYRPDLFRASGPRPVLNSLALSGGGPYGAYGAGLLSGWTAAGTRPKFDVVTGVSTGALSAPFAFLGPKYDPALRHVYTTIKTNDVALLRPVQGLLGGTSLSSNAPLAKIIAHYVTPSFLAEVAREHNRGRRLLIGTTNLDAGRPVIWDMGAIATSGDPNALELFRKVLLASAAIPAAFPPSFFNVTADGYRFEEMHVDGGTTRSVFLAPTQMRVKNVDKNFARKPVRRFYVVLNGYVTPRYKAVKANTLDIAGRSVSTLLASQGVGDLYRLYEFCQVNSFSFNLAFIPDDFPDTSKQPFDPVFMTKLFDLGYREARAGYHWYKEPPGL